MCKNILFMYYFTVFSTVIIEKFWKVLFLSLGTSGCVLCRVRFISYCTIACLFRHNWVLDHSIKITSVEKMAGCKITEY